MNWREGFWRIGVILCVPAFILIGVGVIIYIEKLTFRVSELASFAIQNWMYLVVALVVVAIFAWIVTGFQKPPV
jgi:hypothetical protein